ncbi:acetolactate synthase small subunit-like protein [Phlyctochytrium arcticum]|nr:acetolactate synthase small subunit-like protein [Phlyctochytrium arcticum]
MLSTMNLAARSIGISAGHVSMQACKVPSTLTRLPQTVFRPSQLARFKTSATRQSNKRRTKPAFLNALPAFAPSAEEAVNNIIYNTPDFGPTVVTRHILNCLVSNEPGVLSHVSGILAGRGFNIESLVVAKTEVVDLSRMTIVLNGQSEVITQAKKQLEDMVPVWAVLDYTHGNIVERELLMVKVSSVPHEHLHAFSGDHDVEDTEVCGDYHCFSPNKSCELTICFHQVRSTISPLLGTGLQRQVITDLAKMFGAKVLDVSLDGLIIELSAKPKRVDAFLKLLKPYGIIEAARSGAMAMPRSAVDEYLEESDSDKDQDNDGAVDATMLPPG